MSKLHNMLGEWGRCEKTWALARLHLQRSELAGDAVNDVIVLALEKLDEDHPNPIAWLHLSLKRRCWMLNRRDRYRVRLEDDFQETVSHADVGTMASCHELLAELADLKEEERVALLECCLAGLHYDEIAERHGWTYTKVNRCLAEGRQKLRLAGAVA